MLRKHTRASAPNVKDHAFTILQAAAITRVPARKIFQYLDRELSHCIAIGPPFRAVHENGLLAVRLNFDHSDDLTVAARLEAIRIARMHPKKRAVPVNGLLVRIDLSRAVGMSRT